MRSRGGIACAAVALAAALALPGAAPAAAPARAVRVYLTQGEQFRTVTRPVKAGDLPVAPALRALLAGPTASERARGIRSAIPRDARLRELVIAADEPVRVELSAAFLAGVPAEPARRSAEQRATLHGRLAQVVYTATQFADVAAVRVSVDGRVLAASARRRDYRRPDTLPRSPAQRFRGAPPADPRAVQQALNRLGYLPAKGVTGRADYRTQQAILAFQGWEGLARDAVVGPVTAARLRSAARPTPTTTGGKGRLIEVHRDRGMLLLIENGLVLRVIHASTGRASTPTPTGNFEILRRERRSWSLPFGVWLPYASYFAAGIAFHAHPDVPARPASRGSVRVPAPEAPIVYAFAEPGTRVVVL